MKRFLLLSLLIVDLWAGQAVAVLESLKNDVGIRRNGVQISTPKSGDALYRGDVLFTGSSGALSIVFNDGTAVSLGNKSALKIDDYLFEPTRKQYRFDILLEKGNAMFETGKIGKVAPESVTFRVPEGTIGVRGTRFFVEVH